MNAVVRKARLKDVWVQVSRLGDMPGMDKEQAEDIMRSYIQAEFGQQSTRQLTPDQLKQTADWLRGKYSPKLQRRSSRARHARRDQNMVSLPTDRQKNVLKKMQKTLKLNDTQMKAYCTRILGHDHPRTSEEASTLYQALDALQTHRRRDEMNPCEQVEYCLQHLDQLDGWKIGFVQSLADKLTQSKRLTGRMREKLDEAYRACGGTT